MFPERFNSKDKIFKKIKAISRVHDFENLRVISQIYYDLLKICFYKLKRKKERISGANKNVVLKKKEVTNAGQLIDYHHANDRVFTAEHALTQCFGSNFSEQDALNFFEKFVEGTVEDKYGRVIDIDCEDGIKFMYKNPITQKHEVESKYYNLPRGKRLPWIHHTIKNTSNIYLRFKSKGKGKKQRQICEIMYVAQYDLPFLDEEDSRCYWVVIAHKRKNDVYSNFKSKTAFSITKYNSLLSRLERYDPIKK